MLRSGVNLTARRETEGRVARPRVFEIELDSHRAARHHHPAGNYRVEHAMQWCRVVVDDAVPDVAIAVHEYPDRMALAQFSAGLTAILERAVKIGRPARRFIAR